MKACSCLAWVIVLVPYYCISLKCKACFCLYLSFNLASHWMNMACRDICYFPFIFQLFPLSFLFITFVFSYLWQRMDSSPPLSFPISFFVVTRVYLPIERGEERIWENPWAFDELWPLKLLRLWISPNKVSLSFDPERNSSRSPQSD